METPNPRNSIPLCDNCGERPGSVRLVFATEGGNRAGALCGRHPALTLVGILLS